MILAGLSAISLPRPVWLLDEAMSGIPLVARWRYKSVVGDRGTKIRAERCNRAPSEVCAHLASRLNDISRGMPHYC